MKLFEIDKTKTKTKSRQADDLLNKPFNAPATSKPASAPVALPTKRTQSKRQTSDALANADFSSPEAMRHFMSLSNNMDAIDVSNEPDIEPNEIGFDDTEPGTDLALPPGNDLALKNEVSWHEVSNLPGYFQQAIRALGRQVFAPFTTTPIEEIDVLVNLGGDGPNSQTELNQVAKYLQTNGRHDQAAELEFERIIPGYNAQVSMYTADGHSYLCVKDFAGDYIYSWPSDDATKLGADEIHKQLN